MKFSTTWPRKSLGDKMSFWDNLFGKSIILSADIYIYTDNIAKVVFKSKESVSSMDYLLLNLLYVLKMLYNVSHKEGIEQGLPNYIVNHIVSISKTPFDCNSNLLERLDILIDLKTDSSLATDHNYLLKAELDYISEKKRAIYTSLPKISTNGQLMYSIPVLIQESVKILDTNHNELLRQAMIYLIEQLNKGIKLNPINISSLAHESYFKVLQNR